MPTIVRGNFHDIYFVYPLSQVYGDGLHVSLASLVVQPNYILAAAEDNLVLGATEQLGGHEVTGYDELSVTVTWQVSQGEVTLHVATATGCIVITNNN